MDKDLPDSLPGVAAGDPEALRQLTDHLTRQAREADRAEAQTTQASGMAGLMTEINELARLREEKEAYRFHVIVWPVAGGRGEIFSFDDLEGVLTYLRNNLDSDNHAALFYGEYLKMHVSEGAAYLLDHRGQRRDITDEPMPERLQPIVRLSRRPPPGDALPSA